MLISIIIYKSDEVSSGYIFFTKSENSIIEIIYTFEGICNNYKIIFLSITKYNL